jgi:UrcA family protein
MRQQLVIGTLAAAAILAAPAGAQSRSRDWLHGGTIETVTSRLSLSGIDLSTPKGKALARSLIRREAQRLCEGDGDSPLSVTLHGAACRRAAMREAENEVERLVRSASAREMAAR